MKPTKNHKFCIDCMRPKMLFSSEKKALRCIEMNGEEIFNQSGRRPLRAYYCIACGGWHITSKELRPDFYSPVERYFMKQDEMKRALKKLSEMLPDNNFEKALKKKVGTLSIMVMRKRIIKSQCEEMIHTLIEIFEEMTKAKMITSLTRKYFNCFCNLCTAFQNKVAEGKILSEPQASRI